MTKLNLTSKILLLLTIIFFSVWLGSYIARQLAVYQLFDPLETELKPLYTMDNLTAVLFTLLPLFTLNLISYICLLLAFILFLFQSKINLKAHGWLFIVTLIILVTAPFEIYLSSIDYKIINKIYSSPSETTIIIDLVKERITKLSSFSIIEIFSYITIIFLVLFQPLKKEK